MEPLDEWSVDASASIHLSLVVRGEEGKPKDLIRFQPKYTYQIFGENEAIYGYKGLKIRMRFAAHDLKMQMDVKWDKKVKTVGETKAEDVVEALNEYLPEEYMTDPEEFDRRIQNFDYQSFTPPGKLFNTYKLDGKTYEIWCAPLIDEACKEIIKNIQILILFYIEGGSIIDVDDEIWTNRRWDVYFLYEKTAEYHYTLTGYTTVYRYWFNPPTNSLPTPPQTPAGASEFSPELVNSEYPDNTPDTLPSRARISQFLILPPYQSLGHGGLFYDNIINHLLTQPHIREITVEDPSEAFENLRDLRDLTRLQKNGTLKQITLTTIAKNPHKTLETLRLKNKMPYRQFRRIVEIDLLSRIENKNPQQEKAYRLFVKERIYKQNRDVLAQLDRLERIDKLDETYNHLTDDYLGVLNKLATGPPEGGQVEEVGQEKSDEEMEDADRQGERPKKRVRV